MLRVGYSPATAKTPSKLTESKAWKNLLEKYLPDTVLANVHKQGLKATRREGGEDVPDYAVRHKYLDTAYKVKSRYPREGNINAIQINIDGDRKAYS